MFALKVCLVLVGCVLTVQGQTWSRGCVCSSPCGLGSGENICEKCTGGARCEPIVVRPQELPKPLLAVPSSLTPIPGPCSCRKAIVKPAILPRPVCNPCCQSSRNVCGGEVVGVSTSSSQNIQSQASAALAGIGCGSVVFSDGYLGGNPAVSAPADAVSIAIAQQNAQQHCSLDEDRLAFGFRKIPAEIPVRKIIRQNNIPEEKIFSLNGQIVELKPVKVSCSTKSLDEEAAEDLLALQEEENAAAVVGEASYSPIKRISLGELGYSLAKIQDKTFVDVPVSQIVSAVGSAVGGAVGSAATAAGEAVTGAVGDAVSGVVGDAAGAVGSLVSGAFGSSSSSCGDSSGFRAGNVVYKTVANPVSITIPAAVDTSDCESNEAGEEQSVMYEGSSTYQQIPSYGCAVASGGCGGGCGCGCGPRVYHSSSSSSSSSSASNFKKASIIIQKLCNRDSA